MVIPWYKNIKYGEKNYCAYCIDLRFGTINIQEEPEVTIKYTSKLTAQGFPPRSSASESSWISFPHECLSMR